MGGAAAVEDLIGRADASIDDGVVVPLGRARDRAIDGLQERIAATCGALNRLHGELVDEIAEALRLNLWQQGGICSPEHWVKWRTGVSHGHAKELVRLARRVGELPVCAAELRAGRASLDQLDVVARHVPAAFEAQVGELVSTAMVGQLQRVLSKLPYDDSGAERADEPLPAPPAAEVRTGHDEHGRFTLAAAGPPDDGELLLAALAESRDRLFHAGATDVTPWDALVEMARTSLSAVTSASRADRFRVYLHLDDAGAWFNAGRHVPDAVLRRLTCDGEVRPVFETTGRPLRLGRTTRVVPNDLRRLILDRDRVCRHPACTSRFHLDVHHLVHWSDGGRTDPDNLLALCGRHHRAHHAGEFGITGNPERTDGLSFTDARGRPLTGPRADPSDRSPPTGPAYPGPTGERWESRWFTLDAPDRHGPAPPRDPAA